jgi:hypothetical protein
MAALGAKDALLIDNGGDVMMCFGEDQVLGSAEGERNQLRSVFLFRTEVPFEPAGLPFGGVSEAVHTGLVRAEQSASPDGYFATLHSRR